MADQKLSALTAMTEPEAVDLLYIVDDPAGTPTSKKVTRDNLVADQGWGAITIIDGAGTQTLSATTWTKVTQWEQAGGALLGTSVPSSLLGVQIDAAGYWEARYVVCFDTDSGARDMQFRMYWNAAAQDDSRSEVTATGGTMVMATGQAIIDVTSTGALVELYAYAEAAGDVDIKQASIQVKKLGLT
jgi:hypothetical protein